MQYCPQCGKEVKLEAQFCPECGRKLPGYKKGRQQVEEYTLFERFKRSMLGKIVITLAVLAVLLGILNLALGHYYARGLERELEQEIEQRDLPINYDNLRVNPLFQNTVMEGIEIQDQASGERLHIEAVTISGLRYILHREIEPDRYSGTLEFEQLEFAGGNGESISFPWLELGYNLMVTDELSRLLRGEIHTLTEREIFNRFSTILEHDFSYNLELDNLEIRDGQNISFDLKELDSSALYVVEDGESRGNFELVDLKMEDNGQERFSLAEVSYMYELTGSSEIIDQLEDTALSDNQANLTKLPQGEVSFALNNLQYNLPQSPGYQTIQLISMLGLEPRTENIEVNEIMTNFSYQENRLQYDLNFDSNFSLVTMDLDLVTETDYLEDIMYGQLEEINFMAEQLPPVLEGMLNEFIHFYGLDIREENGSFYYEQSDIELRELL